MSYPVVPWMEVAWEYEGLKEFPGSASNPNILKWAQEIGGAVARDYTTDSIAWCGLLVAICMVRNGILPPDEPLWALNWAKWGVKLDAPCYGAVLSFQRDGGGHVGFYVGETADHFLVLGGNQSDMVNVTKVAKNRLKGIRWPEGMEKFLVPGRIYKQSAASVSHNEA